MEYEEIDIEDLLEQDDGVNLFDNDIGMGEAWDNDKLGEMLDETTLKTGITSTNQMATVSMEERNDCDGALQNVAGSSDMSTHLSNFSWVERHEADVDEWMKLEEKLSQQQSVYTSKHVDIQVVLDNLRLSPADELLIHVSNSLPGFSQLLGVTRISEDSQYGTSCMVQCALMQVFFPNLTVHQVKQSVSGHSEEDALRNPVYLAMKNDKIQCIAVSSLDRVVRASNQWKKVCEKGREFNTQLMILHHSETMQQKLQSCLLEYNFTNEQMMQIFGYGRVSKQVMGAYVRSRIQHSRSMVFPVVLNLSLENRLQQQFLRPILDDMMDQPNLFAHHLTRRFYSLASLSAEDLLSSVDSSFMEAPVDTSKQTSFD